GLMRTGSHLRAEFKGYQQAEANWFSLGATLPFTSMGAERAARQIVAAIRRGQAEKIVSTQATLLSLLSGIAPGMVADFLGFVNRFLPQETGDRHSTFTGSQAEAMSGKLFRTLTTLGRRAAQRLNQAYEPAGAPA